LPAATSLNVTVILTASPTAPVGNGTVTIHGSAGSNSQTASFSLKVVQYRVVMVHSTFAPSALNVTAGSTVYWQNLDGPAGGCGESATGTGLHDVVFTTIQGANSSAISQFDVYTYTFNTPGSYFYYSSLDTDHVMNGTINVVAAGGAGGMLPVSMPSFSYFKASSAGAASAYTTTTTTTVSANPVYAGAATSPVAAGVLTLAGLASLNAHSPVYELGFGAVLAVLLGVTLMALAVATSMTWKRRLAGFGQGTIVRLSLDSPRSAQHA
jgi:plastocyanin